MLLLLDSKDKAIVGDFEYVSKSLKCLKFNEDANIRLTARVALETLYYKPVTSEVLLPYKLSAVENEKDAEKFSFFERRCGGSNHGRENEKLVFIDELNSAIGILPCN